MLVDLPGYGYAEASKSAIKAWTRLVQHYLRGRASLRRVCLLIDSRHGIKEPDRPLMTLLRRRRPVLSDGADQDRQARPGELAPPSPNSVAAELARHTAAHPEIHLTSAEKRLGIAALARDARPVLRDMAPLRHSRDRVRRRDECRTTILRSVLVIPIAGPGSQGRGPGRGAALSAPLCRQDHRRQIWRPCDGRAAAETRSRATSCC